MYNKSEEDYGLRDLTDREINWIMDRENNQTSLLWKMDTPTQSASGEVRWLIRTGNYITLAELFQLGHDRLSCYDLYRTYLSLPVFISTRQHSTSHTADAQYRRNAKMLRHNETGRWGLPQA